MNIYNTFGQLVDQQTFVLANSKIDTKLEFARKLPEGVYYLDLYFFSGRKTLKFVVKY
jgi:hypothetical protein